MTRTADLRRIFNPYLPVFSTDTRKHLEELFSLAEVGERARHLMSALGEGRVGAAAASAAKSASKPAKSDASKSSALKSSAGKSAKGKAAKAPKGKRGRPKKSSAAKAEGGKRRGRTPATEGTLRTTIIDILKAAGKPLSRSEIAEAIKSSAYSSKSSNFSVMLSNAIAKMKSDLKRVGRGVYTVA